MRWLAARIEAGLPANDTPEPEPSPAAACPLNCHQRRRLEALRRAAPGHASAG